MADDTRMPYGQDRPREINAYRVQRRASPIPRGVRRGLSARPGQQEMDMRIGSAVAARARR